MGLDAGPKSRDLFAQAVGEAKTILWNGPAGVFEFPAFAGGSNALLDACIKAAKGGKFMLFTSCIRSRPHSSRLARPVGEAGVALP